MGKGHPGPTHVCCVCAGVEGAPAQPDDLFDPRTQLLALVFAGQPVFPAGRFATGAWLQVGSVMAMLSWALLQVHCQHSAICQVGFCTIQRGLSCTLRSRRQLP